jgi:hypothetical protein
VIAAGLLLLICALCGSALRRLVGLPPASPAAPAVGFAALLVLVTLMMRLPGRAWSAAGVVGVVTVASVVYLRLGGAVGVLPFWAVVLALVVLALALLPFAVSGRSGLLGEGTNDDMAEHLLAAWTLQGHAPLQSSKLLASGYPVGPHSLAATLASATGISLEHAFTGVIVAVPALLALAAAGLLETGPRALRALVAAAVGLCYLQAAYLVQASFKEPIEAVLLVAFAAGLLELELRRPRGAARTVPLAVLAAGSVYVYSYAGVVWPAGTFVLWWLVRGAARKRPDRRIIARVRASAVSFAIGAGAFMVLVAPEIPRMVHFAHSGYNREGSGVYGDLLRALPPQEALGIWPRLDFRFTVPLGSFGGILVLAALVALVACLVAAVHRRDFVVPSALVVASSVYALSAPRSPYTAAKALVIVAPVVTLLLGRELLTLQRSARIGQPWTTAAAAALAGLLVAGVYSDLEVLRDGPVGPRHRAEQLAALRPLIGQQATLFLGADDYVHWELRGANVATPPEPLYTRTVVPLRTTKARRRPGRLDPVGAATTTNRLAGVGLAFDFDSVPSGVLNRFAFAILPRSGYRSVPPANWRLVKTTGSYELWRRAGPTRPRQTLNEFDNPGAILDCATGAGRRIASQPGVAMVRPVPVVGPRTSWQGPVGYAGKAVTQILEFGRGTWAISLQYDGSVGLTVIGPGLRAALPAALEPLGPYWLVGDIHVKRPARVKLVVRYDSLTLLGRVLGAFGLTRAPAPTGIKALGQIAAVPVPTGAHLVPLRRACGDYFDWYETA